VISFIVPLFNHLDQSKEMLATLLHTLPQGLDFEVILIDDASTDSTAAWLGQLQIERVQVIVNEANLGFAKTNNKAIAAAKGEILCLLNNDLVLTTGWLEPLLAVLQAPTLNAGLVGNVQRRIASDDSEQAIDHAGVHVTCGGKLKHIQRLPESPVDHQRVLAVTGACCLIKTVDFNNAGGFDEEFVNGGEDIDLSLKIKQAKKHIYVALQSQIGHHVSLSRDRASLSNERNSRRLQTKWRPELKRAIAKLWAKRLHAKAAEFFDGRLSASFVATPHLASSVMAENILLREEHRWLRLLDHVEPNAGLASRCKTFQSQSSGRIQATVPHAGSEWVSELHVEGLLSARNFFVCGYRACDPNTGDIANTVVLTISSNGIQHKSFVLGPENHVNLGLINPLVLPGIVNVFSITVTMTSACTRKLGGIACMPIIITHFVLDDERVPVAWNG
jgi:GT2 family glycosyltransferase